MAQFKVKIKKESFITLEVTAKDKIDACLLAKHKAKNREGWSKDVYDIVEFETL
jgi:hypothetical protein